MLCKLLDEGETSFNRETKHHVYVKRERQIWTCTWPSFPLTCRLLFIISTHKLVVSNNFLSITFWAVFMCSFSVLTADSQLESAVCGLQYTWSLISLIYTFPASPNGRFKTISAICCLWSNSVSIVSLLWFQTSLLGLKMISWLSFLLQWLILKEKIAITLISWNEQIIWFIAQYRTISTDFDLDTNSIFQPNITAYQHKTVLSPSLATSV